MSRRGRGTLTRCLLPAALRQRDGFTMVEVLIAALLGLCALLVLVPLVRHAGEGFATGVHAGSLSSVVPAVFPHRRRIAAGDAPLAVFSDRFTAWRTDGSLARVELAAGMATVTEALALWWTPPCDAMNPACRFVEDDLALVHDRRGRFTAFRVVAATPGTLGHVPAGLDAAFQLADDPQVARLRVVTVSFDGPSRQLRVGVGGAESPLIDHVVAFEVRYFGDPRPPRRPAPPLGEASCLVDAAGMARLPTLAPDNGPWVELTTAMLSDGPACGAGASSYDADLLRVRRIAVRLRLEAVDAHLRGTDPARFTNPGLARSTAVSHDREVIIDVTPRNLLWP